MEDGGGGAAIGGRPLGSRAAEQQRGGAAVGQRRQSRGRGRGAAVCAMEGGSGQ